MDGQYEIILVDDGSTDKSKKILVEICGQGLVKILHETNKGKGQAIISGLEKTQGQYIAIQDADLEYDPRNLLELFKMAEEKKEIVFGVRDGKKGYIMNRLGNKVLALVCNLLFHSGKKIYDPYTCYKIIPREIMKSLDLKSSGFEIEAEITAKLLKKKINILETPIKYEPRSFKDGKHIGWIDGIKGLMKLFEIKILK
jgi:glycosyltransferase involved in cell wall biosynthesis